MLHGKAWQTHIYQVYNVCTGERAPASHSMECGSKLLGQGCQPGKNIARLRSLTAMKMRKSQNYRGQVMLMKPRGNNQNNDRQGMKIVHRPQYFSGKMDRYLVAVLSNLFRRRKQVRGLGRKYWIILSFKNS